MLRDRDSFINLSIYPACVLRIYHVLGSELDIEDRKVNKKQHEAHAFEIS